MKSILFLLLFVPVFAGAQSKDETAIRKMLAKQVVEWNKGNVEGYMKGYWEDGRLVFIGKNGATYGYQATLDRYKTAYPDKAHMGELTSEIIRMERISDDCYFAIGAWSLKRDAGDVSGSWTLLIRKIKGDWVIVCDHSS